MIIMTKVYCTNLDDDRMLRTAEALIILPNLSIDFSSVRVGVRTHRSSW